MRVVEEAKAAEEALRKRRERQAANAKHRERIHREARESLMVLDFTPEQAAYRPTSRGRARGNTSEQ